MGLSDAMIRKLVAVFLGLMEFCSCQASQRDLERQVSVLFARRCIECHGGDGAKSGLRFDDGGFLDWEGQDGKAILPGKPFESLVFQRVSLPSGHERRMPAKGRALNETEIGWIRDWILAGAPWVVEDPRTGFWSYQRPTKPAVPVDPFPSDTANPIDAFIHNKLFQKGLNPSPQADWSVLLRRLSLDLIGLPPSEVEVKAFRKDPSLHALDREIDRLLASPAFGEKWAIGWLDLARYADSHGFQRDDLRDAWPYRDWVIDALNSDMGFDRFTLEQVAGDLLEDPTLDQLVATGFHRSTPTNVEAGSDREQGRVNQVFDRVNTTATVWMGITLECAQCHDHKYDPFTMEDYYGMFAFFNNTPVETDFTGPNATAALKFTGPYLTVSNTAHSNVGRTLVMEELESPRETRILIRGDFQNPGNPVHAAWPKVFRQNPTAQALNRLDLARFLVSRDNPLTARVFVNRVWMEVFGRGLVATPEDFGIQGDPPSHPDLLDWLAVEFMENGWSLKKLIRWMVTSQTYRQSSGATSVDRQKDPLNIWLGRGPRFRLKAELIRDNALAVSGLLSRKMGGRPARPYQPPGLWESKVGGDRIKYEADEGEDGRRRGVYTVWKRTSPYPSFLNFDANARVACTVERSRSNTPLQALTLLNDPVYVEAAEALADRIETETRGWELDESIAWAFSLCLARDPGVDEIAILMSLYLSEKGVSADPGDQGPTRPWLAVSTALLNLDEMITKE